MFVEQARTKSNYKLNKSINKRNAFVKQTQTKSRKKIKNLMELLVFKNVKK